MKHVTIIDGPLALSFMAIPEWQTELVVPVRKGGRLTISEYRRERPAATMEYEEVHYKFVPFVNGRGEPVLLAFVRP